MGQHTRCVRSCAISAASPTTPAYGWASSFVFLQQDATQSGSQTAASTAYATFSLTASARPRTRLEESVADNFGTKCAHTPHFQTPIQLQTRETSRIRSCCQLKV